MVAGAITSQEGGAPVRKADVVLYRVDVRPNQQQGPLAVKTDAEGRYLFPSVPSGHYRLVASANGFEQVSYGARSSQQSGRLLLLGPNETRLDSDIALRPTGVISGVVVDNEGDPVRHAQVSLLQTTYERGKPRYLPTMQANTNDRGQYRLFGVRAGRYRLSVTANFPRQFAPQPAAANTERPKVFATQFYPNAERFEGAEVLNMTPGREFRNVDFHLNAVPAVKLKGRLVVPPGLAMNAPVHLNVTEEDVPGFHQQSMGQVLSPPDFEFQRDDLRPGRYLVTAQFQAGGRGYQASQNVELGPAGIDGFTVAVETPVELRGAVKLEGGGAGKFSVHLVPGASMQNQGAFPNAAMKEDGSFVFAAVPPGVWDIEVQPMPKGGYLKSMKLGEEDVLTKDMVVTSRTNQTLNIVVSLKGATLEGEVDIPQSHVGLEASVLLAPEGNLRPVLSYYTLKGINTEGEFQMEGLTPGSYRVYAFAELNHRSYQDPEFLKPFAEHGIAIEIKEGERIKLPKRVPLILPGVIPLE